MTSKERVLRTLDHEEPDKVPVGELGIDHDTVEKIIGHETCLRAKAREKEALWAGKRNEVVESYKEDLVELIEKLDHDLVPVHLVPPKGLAPSKIRRIDRGTWRDEQGRIYRYSSGNDAILCTRPSPARSFRSGEEVREYFESHVVRSLGLRIRNKSLGSYEFELEDESQLEFARYVIEKLGKDRFVFFRDILEFEALSVFLGQNPAETMIQEDFFLFVSLHPDLAKVAFDLYTEAALALASIFIKEGVDAIMPAGDISCSTGPMVSPETIRNIFLPGMKRLSDFIHGKGIRVMSHNCGNNWKIMDILIEAGYEAYQGIQSKTATMDLRRLKEEYGERIALWGGINIESLVGGTPEENRKDVMYALRHAAPGGGFILGASNTVAYGSGYENYMAALDTLREYGRYPIQL